MAVGDDDELRIHIAEFLSFIAFACEVGPRWKGRMVMFGGDNQLVRSWVATRRSKVRACRLLIRVLNMVEMRYNCLVVGGWLRTYHNDDADFVTRRSEEEFEKYLEEKVFQRVRLRGLVQQALEDSEKFGPCFLSWGEDEERIEILRLREQRLKRQIPVGLDIDWQKVAVREFAEEGRRVRDFEDARKAAPVGPGPGAVEMLMGSWALMKDREASGGWWPRCLSARGSWCVKDHIPAIGDGERSNFIFLDEGPEGVWRVRRQEPMCFGGVVEGLRHGRDREVLGEVGDGETAVSSGWQGGRGGQVIGLEATVEGEH